MFTGSILDNHVLWCALIAWALAQWLKLPIEYLRTRRWKWALLFAAGGMPSSHSSLMTGTTTGIGLFYGFNTPLFALAFAITMVVVYDATGVRRQAGRHAAKINILINELFSGHPISQDQLKEVLGHSPREALAGILLGIGVALVVYFITLAKAGAV